MNYKGKLFLFPIILALFLPLLFSCSKKENGSSDSSFPVNLFDKKNRTYVIKSPWETITYAITRDLNARGFKQLFYGNNDKDVSLVDQYPPTTIYHVDGRYRRADNFPPAPKGTLVENLFDRRYVGKLVDKDDLMETLSKNESARKYLLKQWTYTYPVDSLKQILSQAFSESPYIILKPAEGFGGHGITIIKNTDSFDTIFSHIKNMNKQSDYSRWVLQEYMGDPLLFRGHKFHFRSYLMARRVGTEIKFFTYPESWMYVAAKEYGDPENALLNIDDKQRHLTNIKLGGHEHLFPKDIENNLYEGVPGHEVAKYINEQMKILMYQTASPIAKSLVCRNRSNIMCFEVFGVDIMIDKNFNLKLLEVNSGTGYGANYEEDFSYGICWEEEFISSVYRSTIDFLFNLTNGTDAKNRNCNSFEMVELNGSSISEAEKKSTEFRQENYKLFK